MIEIASPHKRKSHDSEPRNLKANLNVNRKHCHSEDLSQPEPKTDKVYDFQSDNAKVILSGLVMKKCGWFFFKTRQLMLNSKPRLVYYDPETSQLKVFLNLFIGIHNPNREKYLWLQQPGLN